MNQPNGWFKILSSKRPSVGGFILMRGDWYYQPGGNLLFSFAIDGDKSPYIVINKLCDLSNYRSVSEIRLTENGGYYYIEMNRTANYSNVEITTFVMYGYFADKYVSLYNTIVAGSGTVKGSQTL